MSAEDKQGKRVPNEATIQNVRVVNGYEFLAEVGSGGMSRVYRARHMETGELVAIKAIPTANIAEDYQARLEREPEIQQGLGHENIIRLVESFHQGAVYYLVMEYVEGRSLAQILYAESGPLAFDRARYYLRQVLRAMDHLHGLGIVHRDIKPSNILVRRDDVVKLADFGIAKFTWQGDSTATRRGLGTPEYMSPEQVRGEGIDHRTDIYSLGITLFEMLTARRPFTHGGDTPMAYVQVIEDVLKAPLPDPRTYQPSIPEEAVRLIDIATAKNPDDRFRNTREMAEALDAVHVVDSSPATLIGVGGAAPGPVNVEHQEEPAQAQPEREEVKIHEAISPASIAAAHIEESHYASLAGDAGNEPSGPIRPSRRRMMFILVPILAVVLGLGAYALTGGFGLGNKDVKAAAEMVPQPLAVAVADSLADRLERSRMVCAITPIASLYAPDEMQYHDISNATREDVEREIAKLCARVAAIESFTIRVDTAWGVPGGVEALWTIESVWRDRGGERLRDSILDRVRIEKRLGEWLITEQRHLRSFTERFDGKVTAEDTVTAPAPARIVRNERPRNRVVVREELPREELPSPTIDDTPVTNSGASSSDPAPKGPVQVPPVIQDPMPQPNDPGVSRPRRPQTSGGNENAGGDQGGGMGPRLQDVPPDTPREDTGGGQ